MSGGVSLYVYNLSRNLVNKGNVVTVITRGSHRNEKVTEIDGIRLFRAPFIPLFPFHVYIHGLFVQRIVKRLEKSIDVLHLHVPLPPYVDTTLPVLATFHGLPEYRSLYIHPLTFRSLSEGLFSAVVYNIEKKIVTRANKIASVSKKSAIEIEHYFGYNLNNIDIASNGVDSDFFTLNKEEKKEFNILYVGRLDYKKGLIDLVNAGKKIISNYPNTKFTLVGSGPLLNTLIDIVDRNNIRNSFFFPGHVDQKTLRNFYQESSIFILPSYYEGLPNVILEAMACGLPIISTKVGGIPDVLENEKNGLFIPTGDPEAIESAIIRLINDADTRKEMGVYSREMVEKHFSWDVVSNRYLELYQSLLE